MLAFDLIYGLAVPQHTLELALSEGRRVAGDDDEFGLAGPERLEGRLVSCEMESAGE